MMLRVRRTPGIDVAHPNEDLVRKPSRPSREATSTGCSASTSRNTSAVTLATVPAERVGRRLERYGVFVSHITDGKVTEVWRKHETSR